MAQPAETTTNDHHPDRLLSRLEVAPGALAAFCRKWHIAKLEAVRGLEQLGQVVEGDGDFGMFRPEGALLQAMGKSDAEIEAALAGLVRASE